MWSRRQVEPASQATLVKGLRIEILQPAQALDPAQLWRFKKKERSRVSTHAPSFSVCTNYTSAIEQYIRQIAHHEGNHIHLYSGFSPKNFPRSS